MLWVCSGKGARKLSAAGSSSGGVWAAGGCQPLQALLLQGLAGVPTVGSSSPTVGGRRTHAGAAGERGCASGEGFQQLRVAQHGERPVVARLLLAACCC